MRAQIRGAQRLRLGLVISLFAGMGAVMLFLPWQITGQPKKGDFQPRVMASFKKDDLLQLGVAVALDPERCEVSSVRIDLIGEKGENLAGADCEVGGRANRSENLVEFKVKDKAMTQNSQVRITHRGASFQVPLARVLVLKGHETTLSTGQEFYVASQAPLSCTILAVRSLTENVPQVNAEVSAYLKDKDGKVYSVGNARTNADGRADLLMRMPDVAAGQYTLEILTHSMMGDEKLARAVKLKADAKILLTSDKPIYQPGHMMHLRALVLRPVDMKPVANKEMQFEIEDAKGNKVFKKTLTTSEYGIASVDFQLAEEVNMGDYHVRAAVGEHRADKTVTVKRYVLPKFKVNVKADKTFYLPKEKIQVELQGDYFFGKPVSKAKIEASASTFDVQFREFHKWSGTTDENGHAKFEIQLPDYFVGQPLEKGNALVKLEVKVLDSADHKEIISRAYPVSDQSIQVNLIAEGGKLAPGLENRVFAAAMYPDGSPAVGCDVRFWLGKEAKGEPFFAAKTNAAGLAEFRLSPKAEQFRQHLVGPQDVEFLGGRQQFWGPQFVLDIHAQARDVRGNQAASTVMLNSQPMGENVLLRLDKAIYQTGDSMNIEVRTSAGLPTIYIDVVRGGQIMLSRWYDVKDGQASQRLDLPANVFGSLEIHAYQMLAHGEIIRDSRVVYVQSRDELKIDVMQDKGEYLPGANGRLTFKVTDAKGNATPAALGIIIVDEAVYALQEMQPGLEKVYFTLQEELLKPKVDFKFSPGETLDNLILQRAIPAPRQQVAEVLLTAVKLPVPARWEVNPGVARQQQVQNQVRGIGAGLFQFAWNRGQESFIVFNKTAKKWEFRPGLLEDAVKANFLNKQQIESPIGGQFTLDDLIRLEKGFTVDALAQAVTVQRIQQLAGSVMYYANLHRDRFFKNERWELPETILEEIVAKQRYEARMLKDAWGQRSGSSVGTKRPSSRCLARISPTTKSSPPAPIAACSPPMTSISRRCNRPRTLSGSPRSGGSMHENARSAFSSKSSVKAGSCAAKGSAVGKDASNWKMRGWRTPWADGRPARWMR